MFGTLNGIRNKNFFLMYIGKYYINNSEGKRKIIETMVLPL
jgi:hypothetical protein